MKERERKEESEIYIIYIHKSINKSSVNPKSTSNQSSKPCTVLQYPSTKESEIYIIYIYIERERERESERECARTSEQMSK